MILFVVVSVMLAMLLFVLGWFARKRASETKLMSTESAERFSRPRMNGTRPRKASKEKLRHGRPSSAGSRSAIRSGSRISIARSTFWTRRKPK
jgi:hypothetical protein